MSDEPQATGIALRELMDIRQWRQAVLPQAPQRHSLRGRRTGAHRSRALGRGLEFSQVRAYQAGDDARQIDWRVTARRGRAHTKLYEVERDRPVLLALDWRAHMFFGTGSCLKAVGAAQLAAALAWQSCLCGDRVGTLLHSSSDHSEWRPRAGERALVALFQHWVNWFPSALEAEGDADLASLCQRLWQAAPSGHYIVLISDFWGLSEQALSQLSHVCQHNQVLLIQVYDPLECRLPEADVYPVQWAGQEHWLDTRDPQVAEAYRQRFEQSQSDLERHLRALGAGFDSLCLEHSVHAQWADFSARWQT